MFAGKGEVEKAPQKRSCPPFCERSIDVEAAEEQQLNKDMTGERGQETHVKRFCPPPPPRGKFKKTKKKNIKKKKKNYKKKKYKIRKKYKI